MSEGASPGGPSGEWGSLVCSRECPGTLRSSTICAWGPEMTFPAPRQQEGWTRLSQTGKHPAQSHRRQGEGQGRSEASRVDSPWLHPGRAGPAVLGAQVPALTGEIRLSHGCGLATVPVGPLGHYS